MVWGDYKHFILSAFSIYQSNKPFLTISRESLAHYFTHYNIAMMHHFLIDVEDI